MCCPVYYQFAEAVRNETLLLLTEEEYRSRFGNWQPVLTCSINEPADVSRIRLLVDDFLKTKVSKWHNPVRRRVLVGLSEMITNVVKYTPGGHLSLYIRGDTLCFHVIDRGAGLTQRCLPSLLFVKGNSSSDSLGMGFHIARHYFKRIGICTSDNGTKLVLWADLNDVMMGL